MVLYAGACADGGTDSVWRVLSKSGVADSSGSVRRQFSSPWPCYPYA